MPEDEKSPKEVPFSVHIRNAVKELKKATPEYRRELLIRSGNIPRDPKSPQAETK